MQGLGCSVTMKLFCLFAFLIVGSLAYIVPANEPSESLLELALRRDFRNYIKTGNLGRILRNVKREIDFGSLFLENNHLDNWSEPKVSLFCSTCAAGVNEILSLQNPSLIFETAINLCVDLGFGTQFVCENLIHANEDELIFIVENTPDETGNDVCGTVFVGRGCVSRNPDRIWEVVLPNTTKPPIDETPYPDPASVPTLKILHLADTHFDPIYAPYTSQDCEELYLCCREESNPRNNSQDLSGFWGSYGACDLPFWTLEAMYANIAETHPDIAIIVWTGDLVPHAVWNTSREGNLQIINQMADLISTYFPDAQVYPSVGNHEADPLNLFPQPYVTDPQFEISWLYDEFTAVWQRWLPEEAASSVAYSAYYSVPIRPGLRMISVNTMYCYGMNWYLIHDSTDIADELDLIAKELQKSEDIGEFVYLIGHIPAGNGECSLTWSHEFNKVVARYENTISGIFYGHTHKDHWQVFFDPDDHSRPMEIAYIAQSQTTYTNMNPGYKIYTIEGDFEGSRYRVLDHDNYILDLTIANTLNRTDFPKLYSAKEEYALTDLSPASWLDLIFKMNATYSPLFDLFYRNYYKSSYPHLNDECDEDCKAGFLCDLLISDNSDHSTCDILYP